MRAFTYDAHGGRILFGSGRHAEVATEAERLGLERVLVVASESNRITAEGIVHDLGRRFASRWHRVAQHVPTHLAEAARLHARDAEIDGIVALGGGSSTGLAKAIALAAHTPIIAVPTTYAGSEMTPIYGLTADDRKQTGWDANVLPRVVIYDPVLTMDLPRRVTASSAFNALAHCVEAMYGPNENPISTLMAGEGMRVSVDALKAVNGDPRDVGARSDLLYGACLAAGALAIAGTALHHNICHVLGGTFGIVHGDANAVMLPHVVSYNSTGAPDAVRRVSRSIDADDAGSALFDLAAEVGAPSSLAELGMPQDRLDDAARRAVAETRFNPVSVDERRVRALLDDAWHGRRPAITGAPSP